MEGLEAVFYMFLGAGCYVIGRGLGNMIFDIMEKNENKTDI